MAPEMKRLYSFAERYIRGIQGLVDLRCQAAWHIPIVRLRQHNRAAEQSYPSITDRFRWRHAQLSTQLGRFRSVRVRDSCCNDAWRRCQSMSSAPMLESQGRTVIAQQFGVQCLEQRHRLDTRNETPRPRRRSRCCGVIRTNCQQPQQRDTTRTSRFANTRRHFWPPPTQIYVPDGSTQFPISTLAPD